MCFSEVACFLRYALLVSTLLTKPGVMMLGILMLGIFPGPRAGSLTLILCRFVELLMEENHVLTLLVYSSSRIGCFLMDPYRQRFGGRHIIHMTAVFFVFPLATPLNSYSSPRWTSGSPRMLLA